MVKHTCIGNMRMCSKRFVYVFSISNRHLVDINYMLTIVLSTVISYWPLCLWLASAAFQSK